MQCKNRCTSFPKSFSEIAGISNPIPDSVSVTKYLATGNITSQQTVDVVDQYISAVYSSSGGTNDNPYGCEVNGLATLSNCPSPANTRKSLRADGDIVKSVTLAGAFVPDLWATGNKVLSMDEVKAFYTTRDFNEMVKLGVNTVQIPVPCDAFVTTGEVANTVSHLLDKIGKAGLSAILVLVEIPDPDGEKEIKADAIIQRIKSAATFASSNSPTIIALQIPSPLPSLLSAVRSASSTLPVLVPTNKGQLKDLSFPPDSYLFAALDVGASTSIADVASSDSEGDRLKMFYHESITCIDRSPIEWLDCFRDMPVYVTEGFDLSVDDCIRRGQKGFKNYGQCDRFNETIGSGWWERHRQSLASRQLFTYSKGLGWSFSGWKLFGDDGDDGKKGNIDSPAKLLCLRDVAAAGLMPSLSGIGKSSLSAACLNGPKADFVMGDATFAPIPAPPPDCGYGWWNFTTKKCDYWIPPPPTPSPTEKPTMPCPSCKEMGTIELATAIVAGAVVALVLNWLVKKMCGRNEGYERLP